MATDFTYGKKTIAVTGGFRPKLADTPLDVRTRVELKADIAKIPMPFVGMRILVKADETNDNKMTEYIVKSLKPNALGIANMAIDEVIKYKEFLGIEEYEVVPVDELLTMYDEIQNA